MVNIGSVNAYCGEENLLPYSISKGALMTLSRNLGDTLMRQRLVRVNQINPGWVLTANEIKFKQAEGMKSDWWADLAEDVCAERPHFRSCGNGGNGDVFPQ